MEFLGFGCMMAIGFPVVFLCWAAVINRIRPRHYWLWIAVSVPATALITVITYVCLGASLSCYRSLPSVVFRDSFGFDFTSDVKILKSSSSFVIDWEMRQLEFFADRSTIDRIVKGGFRRVAAREIEESRNAPWWGPIEDETAEYYAKDIHSKVLPSRYFAGRILIFQSSSKKAY
jgi:hypothetical protein